MELPSRSTRSRLTTSRQAKRFASRSASASTLSPPSPSALSTFCSWLAKSKKIKTITRYTDLIEQVSSDNCSEDSDNFFNSRFYLSPLTSANWSDVTEATTLKTNIADDCGTDSDCYTDGCRWSVIFAFCGISLAMMACNNCILLAGAWNFHTRAFGACCASLLCCVNFSAIITTGVFRYNNWGSLAALSLDGVFPTATTVND